MRNAFGYNYKNSSFIGADTTFHRTHFQFSNISDYDYVVGRGTTAVKMWRA